MVELCKVAGCPQGGMDIRFEVQNTIDDYSSSMECAQDTQVLSLAPSLSMIQISTMVQTAKRKSSN